MNQTIFRYSIFHRSDDSVVEPIQSLQYVEDATRIVQVSSGHPYPEVDTKTKIRIETTTQEDFEKLEAFLDNQFLGVWFNH